MSRVIPVFVAGLAALSASAAQASTIFYFSYAGAGIAASGDLTFTANGDSGVADITRNGVTYDSYQRVVIHYTDSDNFSIMLSYDDNYYVWWAKKTNGVLTNGQEEPGPAGNVTSGTLSDQPAPAPVPGAGLLSLAFFALVAARSRAGRLVKAAFGRG